MSDEKLLPIQFEGRQRRIERQLGLIGDGPQAYYRDGVRLAATTVLESGAALLAHLSREVDSMLRRVLQPITGHKAQNSTTLCPQCGSPVEKKDSLNQQIDTIASQFKLESDTVRIWKKLKLHRHAHRDSYNRPRSVQDATRRWTEFEGVLSVVLDAFETRYLEFHQAIDKLIEKPAPTGKDIAFISSTLPSSVKVRQYLFGTLKQPGWLKPLRNAELFDDPPGVIRDESGQRIQYALWPQATYLEAMAGNESCQKEVAEILLSVPITDNGLVHLELSKAAVRLPASVGVTLTDRIIEWNRVDSYAGLLSVQCGLFAGQLAQAGHKDEAFRVLEEILNPAGERLAQIHGRGSHESYEYAQVLKHAVEVFAPIFPTETIDLLCNILTRILPLDLHTRYDPHSSSWRRSVASSTGWRRYEMPDVLVDALRDAGMAAASHDPDLMPAIVRRLDQRDEDIFERITNHLLANASRKPADIDERILDREAFNSWRYAPEYLQVLKRWIAEADEATRQTLLDWIAAGPDLSDLTIETEEDRDRIVGGWQRPRVAALQAFLPEELETRRLEIEVAAAAFKTEPEDDEDGAVFVGPTSPITEEDLKSRTVQEVLDLLRRWKPKPGWREASPDGLGRTLEGVVSAAPVEYAAAAGEFIGLEPTYVRSLIGGLAEAVKKEHIFPWIDVLRLCRWVIQQPDTGTQQADRDRDPDWSWTRNSIVRLFKEALNIVPGQVPIDLREQLWNVLAPLTDDPDPAPDREKDRDGMDFLGTAINSVRGNAMFAVLQYAVWAKRQLDAAHQAPTNMSALPEVAEVLDAHLDIERDPSLAIRSVFGEAFPTLHWLDATWTSERVLKVFPSDPAATRYRDAALATFLIYRPAFSSLWPIMRAVYEDAVRDIGEHAAADHDKAHARLGIHLLLFHTYGLEGADTAIREFMQRAPAALQRTVLDQIGRYLSQELKEAKPEMIERVRSFWDWYDELAEKQEDRQGLQAFGWWLAGGKLGLDWSASHALTVLKRGEMLEPDHLVVEYLIEVAPANPKIAADIVLGLAGNLRDEWSFHGWHKEARIILQTVFGSGDANAIAAGRAAINLLGARGHIELLDLLRPPSPPKQK
jgi:hypothetical protein